MLRYFRWLIPLAVLMAALAVRALDPQIVAELRFNVFDTYQRIAPRAYEPLPVAVIDIDNESLSRLGQWPWPRTRLAQLTQNLKDAGTASIAYDIIFAEPDRTSPDRVVKTWPSGAGRAKLQQLLAADALPDHDGLFAESLAQTRSVTGFALADRANDTAPPRKAGFAHSGPTPARFVPRFDGAVSNIDAIAAASQGNGSLNVLPESDGVVRRIPLLVAHDDTLHPSLAAEALRVAQGASTYLIKTSGSGDLNQTSGIEKVKIGRVVVPTDSAGRVWLYDSGLQQRRQIPAWKVLAQPETVAERLRGAIVIVGSSAVGLKDHHPTPMNAATPGVTLHAQIIEQALTRTFLHRPDWAMGAELLAVAALGLFVLSLFLIPKLSILAASIITLGVIVSIGGAAWAAFTEWRWLVDPVYPGVTALAVYMAASLPRYLQVESEKRRVRNAFTHYMSPALVEQLAEHPEDLTLGGETRDLTVLFCDIRGFTTLAEQMDADAITSLLNRFLTPMTDAIMETGGTIDKYMGDAIMAFWNAPLTDPAHAANACAAVHRMRRELRRLNTDIALESDGGGADKRIAIGIGLNSGPCSVGNMGSSRRFDYSALGDNVNLASRLEGQCKTYSTDIILSEATADRAPDELTLELDLIRVKGRQEPVRIYTLLDAETSEEAETVTALQAAHAAMLSAYRQQDWATARTKIEICRSLAGPFGLDGLYDVYAQRVEKLAAEPPPPNWDGVFKATTK